MIRAAAEVRSVPKAAWPSNRTVLVLVEPAFSSTGVIGEAVWLLSSGG
jgi:hypothetical protein